MCRILGYANTNKNDKKQTMTKEECYEKLCQIDRDYKQALIDLNYKKVCEKTEVLDKWANENAEFNVGDIIEANGIIIKVEKIFGNQMAYERNTLYCMYQGSVLTKKLQPRKDHWNTTIPADSRIIKKLK